jgi:hypothetical protein
MMAFEYMPAWLWVHYNIGPLCNITKLLLTMEKAEFYLFPVKQKVNPSLMLICLAFNIIGALKT